MVTMTLEAARVNVKLTQEEAAKKLGVSKKQCRTGKKDELIPQANICSRSVICMVFRWMRLIFWLEITLKAYSCQRAGERRRGRCSYPSRLTGHQKRLPTL